MMPLHPSFYAQPLAHRGYHAAQVGRPENSIGAITAAIDAGYGVEIDIQPSKDGMAMVFHDYDLGRLTGKTGPIQQIPAKELGAIHLTGSAEKIPTLAEVLELVGGRCPLLIEIKDQDGVMGPKVGMLERAVADCLENYHGTVAVMSFNPNSVAALRDSCPNVPRGITTSAYSEQDWQLLPSATRDRLRNIPDFDSVEASFISHEAADLARPRVKELKSAGAAIFCWTVRSKEEELQARLIADNITFEGYAAEIPSA